MAAQCVPFFLSGRGREGEGSESRGSAEQSSDGIQSVHDLEILPRGPHAQKASGPSKIHVASRALVGRCPAHAVSALRRGSN